MMHDLLCEVFLEIYDHRLLCYIGHVKIFFFLLENRVSVCPASSDDECCCLCEEKLNDFLSIFKCFDYFIHALKELKKYRKTLDRRTY